MYLKLAQKLSDYIYDNYDFEQQYVVLNFEDPDDLEKAKEVAAVFAGNGVNCYMFENPASEKEQLEAIKKLESPAGFFMGKDGCKFYGNEGEMPVEVTDGFVKEAEVLTEDDIVTSEFGVSFSFMRIMYIEP